MLIAVYRTQGSDALFNSPQLTLNFRIEVGNWSMNNNASYTQVSAKFGYVGIP